jgi:hypothetical protein
LKLTVVALKLTVVALKLTVVALKLTIVALKLTVVRFETHRRCFQIFLAFSPQYTPRSHCPAL